MNTPMPTARTPEPLTPEEHALATRLAKLGPHGEPSPVLDARIIGAAHAAAAQPARTQRRRWPALLGLAATLALAVGVTWRMAPPGEPALAGDEAPPAITSEAAAVIHDSAAPAPAAKQPAAPVGDGGPPQDANPQVRTPRPMTVPPAEAPAAASAPAKPVPRAFPAMPPPPPIPTAPAAQPSPPRSVAQTAEATDASQAPRDTSTRMRDSSTESAAARPLSGRAAANPMAAGAPASAQASDDLPVAQDRQLEPADWLERIRLRRDRGDLAGARESLEMFRRWYPQAALPDDLRMLAASPVDQP